MTVRVLVIDDDEAVRETICSSLEAGGLEATGVNDGIEGIAAFEPGAYDVVVSDILMPGKEGIETIRTIRGRSREVKILAISGGDRNGSSTFLDMALKLGADASIVKPFRPSELLAVINSLLDDKKTATA